MELTVVDWNLGHAYPRGYSAEKQGRFLLELRDKHSADLILLQEVRRRNYEELGAALSGHYSSAFSLDLDGAKRERSKHGCAIFAREGLALSRPRTLPTGSFANVPDERVWDLVLLADLRGDGRGLTVGSIHIPNARGRGKYRRKRAAIRAVARELALRRRRTIVGIDANGPKQDALDPESITYWPKNRLEYLLHNPTDRSRRKPYDPMHLLRDVYRVYVEDQGLEAEFEEASPSSVGEERRKLPVDMTSYWRQRTSGRPTSTTAWRELVA